MNKLKGQLILLSIIAICLVSLAIFSLVQMFNIDIISGIIGVIVCIILNTIMIYFLYKTPNWEKSLNKYLDKATKDLESEN